MPNSLPVISLMNSIMTVQGYLSAVTGTVLPPVIRQNEQYASLVTQFTDWQEDLWSQFWEGLVAAGVVAESIEVSGLFGDGIIAQNVFQSVFYDNNLPVVVAQCDVISNFITRAQPLLAQLEAIAEAIENADKQAVEQLKALVDQLQQQFEKQEDTLTSDALDSAVDIVATAVNVMIAVGSDGASVQPLVKGVIKLGTDVVNELVLTGEINQTLDQLESAWAALDAATTALAQITLTYKQIKAVLGDASETLTQLQNLSNDWNNVASTTQQDAANWQDQGCASLQQWAGLMLKLSFSNATQTVELAAVD